MSPLPLLARVKADRWPRRRRDSPRIRSPPIIRRRSRVEDRGARQILRPLSPLYCASQESDTPVPAIKVQDAYTRPTLDPEGV